MDAPSVGYRRTADPLFRFVVGTALVLGTAFVASYLYWGSGPILGETPWYIPTMHAFTGLAAIIVAFLALGRHRVLRDAPSYWIGIGFAAFGILSVFFILTWPGLAPGGQPVIARLPGTSAWMAVLELATLSLSLLAAVFARWPGEKALAGTRWPWSVAAWLVAITLLASLAVAFEGYLPPLVGAGGSLAPLLLTLDWALLLLFAAGAFFSTRRYLRTGDTLLGYVAITQVALAFVVLTALIGTKRYDVWYYLSRIIGVGGFLSMMFGLLSEYVGLFRRERDKTRELEARTAELLGVLKSSPEAVFVTDEKGGVRLASRKALDLLGARSERELWRPVSEWATPFETRDREGRRLPPDELPLARVGRGEVVQEEEVQFRDPRNGSAIWLLVSGGPLADEQGRRIGGLLVGTDITERRAAEEALRDSEERLRIAVESVNLGTWDLDLATDVAVRSLRHDQIWGYEEPQAKWGLEIAMRNVVPEDRQLIMDAYARAMETGVLKHENRVVWPDGSIHWIDVDGRVYRDSEGRAVRVIGVVADVTERKQADAERERLHLEVQRRAAELDAVVSSMVAGVAMYDAAGRLILMNPAGVRMLGYSEADKALPLAERIAVMRMESRDGRSLSSEETPVGRALRGETVQTDTMMAHLRDGRSFWMWASAAPILGPDGQVLGAVATFTDVSEQLGLQQAQARLLGEQEELLEAERESREQAERAVRIRDEFLYVAAHELKTPVTSLRGFSQVVLRKFKKSGTLEQDLVVRALSRIDQQSKRLSALTEELLNVSRLETGKLTVMPEEVDVPSVVSAAIASVRESHPDRAFLFREDVSVRACLDPSRMEQVIINLLDNAAKFSPEEAPVEIDLGRYGHDEVAISVRDYGRGIPEEHRERIFERFYQAHEERHYGGLGLGLYISSQIVQMHGGTITYEAPAGKGARFVVRLPLGCGNGRDN